jgi:hypothetical protein
MDDTFSSRPNISSQFSVPSSQLRGTSDFTAALPDS